MPGDTNAAGANGGAPRPEKPNSKRHRSRDAGQTRPTTYARELYRLRESGALDGLGLRALDVFGYVCHLADVFGRDAVFRQQAEIMAALRCKERTTRDAVRELEAFRTSEGRALVYVEAHRARPDGGYRRATLFTLGTAFPAEARWSNRVDELPKHSSTSVPTDLGAGTNESIMAVGQWNQLAVGYRPQVGVRVARQDNLDNLTVKVVAFIRADVAVLRPAAFEVLTGLLPAA